MNNVTSSKGSVSYALHIKREEHDKAKDEDLQHGTAKVGAFISAMLADYKQLAKNVKHDHTVVLRCFVANREFDVYKIGVFCDEFLFIAGKTADGSEFRTYASMDSVSFNIRLTKKAGPSREIGFAAEMKERSKHIV